MATAVVGGNPVPARIPLPRERATNFELQAEFAMASDPSGAVSRTYGVWQAGSGLNKRGRFIIDPDGIIQGVEVLAGPIGRNVEELLRQIKAMQAVRANPGKAAPGIGPERYTRRVTSTRWRRTNSWRGKRSGEGPVPRPGG